MAAKRKTTKAIVKEEPSLERDFSSNAILNKDSRSYHLARSRKKILKQKNLVIADLKSNVGSLEQRLSLLEKVVNSMNK